MFEDAAGKELVYLQAQKNRYQHVKNDEGLRVERNREKLVAGSEDEVTEGDHRTRVLGGRHVIVEAVKKELIGGDSHLHVRGDEIGRVDGDSSLVAGGEIHLESARAIVIDGASDLTLKGPGGFIRIDARGVTIVGTVVNINSGGAPGVASARSAPEAPDRAEAGPAMQAAVAQLQLTDTQIAERQRQQARTGRPQGMASVEAPLQPLATHPPIAEAQAPGERE
jgi:type VI secretion system secreted protein VgrG